jgi:hypothetical protein
MRIVDGLPFCQTSGLDYLPSALEVPMIRLLCCSTALFLAAAVPAFAQRHRPEPKIGEDMILNAKGRENLKVEIAAAGLNCPTLAKATYVEENVRERIIRIDCRSSDKTSVWSIRATSSPGDPQHLIFEAW